MVSWQVLCFMSFVLLGFVSGSCNHTEPHNLRKREEVSKYKHSVPIIFKGEFACSGTMASHRLVLTTSSCVKKGIASNYKVIITDDTWRADKSPIGFTLQVEKILSDPKANEISLLQLVNFVKNPTILNWDTTGKLQPWVRKDTVTISGWEGKTDEEPENEEEGVEEYEDDNEEDEGSDESVEYTSASYAAIVDRLCPQANTDPVVLCLTPKKTFECKGFKGGAVLTKNILVGVITDTDDCKHMRAVQIYPSIEWLKSHIPKTRSKIIAEITKQLPMNISIRANEANDFKKGMTLSMVTMLVAQYVLQ